MIFLISLSEILEGSPENILKIYIIFKSPNKFKAYFSNVFIYILGD